MIRYFFSRFFLALLSLPFLAGCATLEAELNPPLEKQVLSSKDRVISDEEAEAMFYEEMEENGFLYDDFPEKEWVDGVIRKILQASHDKVSNFKVHLFANDEANAASTGGKHIFITEGLLKYAESDPNRIAGILAHEIAHDLAGHGERIPTSVVLLNLVNLLIQASDKESNAALVSEIGTTLFSNRYSRDHEIEADILGTVYAVRAGYDPNGLIQFFQSISEEELIPGVLLDFIHSHPSYERRAETVKLVERYLKGGIDLQEIAQIDPKMAQTLDTVERLDLIQTQPQVEPPAPGGGLFRLPSVPPGLATVKTPHFLQAPSTPNSSIETFDLPVHLLSGKAQVILPFQLEERTTVSLDLQVVRGPAVDFWFTNQAVCSDFQNAPDKVAEGNFPSFPELSASQARGYHKKVAVPAGGYCFVLLNRNLENSVPSTSRVKVRVSLEKPELRR